MTILFLRLFTVPLFLPWCYIILISNHLWPYSFYIFCTVPLCNLGSRSSSLEYPNYLKACRSYFIFFHVYIIGILFKSLKNPLTVHFECQSYLANIVLSMSILEYVHIFDSPLAYHLPHFFVFFSHWTFFILLVHFLILYLYFSCMKQAKFLLGIKQHVAFIR